MNNKKWLDTTHRSLEALTMERIGVLVRKGSQWDETYQYRLGHMARRLSRATDPQFQGGIELILEEFGLEAAIGGWCAAKNDSGFDWIIDDRTGSRRLMETWKFPQL